MREERSLFDYNSHNYSGIIECSKKHWVHGIKEFLEFQKGGGVYYDVNMRKGREDARIPSRIDLISWYIHTMHASHLKSMLCGDA